jgi:hypothetical protein
MPVTSPSPDEHAPFHRTYISLVASSIDPVRALEEQRDSFSRQVAAVSEDRGDYRYGQGKWSIKELVGHLGDTERILSYRLLCIARGDVTPLPGFDEDDYVAAAGFDRLLLADLVEDWLAVRAATVRLVRGLSDEAWMRIGTSNGSTASARALLFIILGHAEHHRVILEDRYGVSRVA